MTKRKPKPPMFSIIINKDTTQEYLEQFTVPELRHALKEYTRWIHTSNWNKDTVINKLLQRADEIKQAYKKYASFNDIKDSTPTKQIEKEIQDWGKSKYQKKIKTCLPSVEGFNSVIPSCVVDVYSVLNAFEVTNPAIAHAIKKLLMPGMRGKNSTYDNLKEAVVAIERAIQIEGCSDGN